MYEFTSLKEIEIKTKWKNKKFGEKKMRNSMNKKLIFNNFSIIEQDKCWKISEREKNRGKERPKEKKTQFSQIEVVRLLENNWCFL